MEVLNIVYPGLSKYRGLIIHEQCETLLTRAGILFNRGTISKVFMQALRPKGYPGRQLT